MAVETIPVTDVPPPLVEKPFLEATVQPLVESAVPSFDGSVPLVQPAQEDKSVQPNQEVKQIQPAEADESVQADQPDEQDQLVEPVQPVQPVQPTEEDKPTGSNQAAQSSPPAQAESEQPKPDVVSITEKLASTLSFSPEALKAKYREERDKRLRFDGNSQYKEFKGQFSHYLTDPYTPRVEREPRDVETDFMVLGAGFGGLLMAAELSKAGIQDFLIVDKAGDFGGTWYWNRYPGAACDIGKPLSLNAT
jgi:hypothetical protein